MRLIWILCLVLGCAPRTEPQRQPVEVTRVDPAPGVVATVLDVKGVTVVWLDETAVTP